MEREEAINLIKQVLPCLNIDEKIREGFVTLIPELKESEDERIRKALIEFLREAYSRGNAPEECAKMLAYLEKQKPAQTDDEREYVRTLKSLISDFLCGKEEVDREYYQQIFDWLDGRHIEQEPEVKDPFDDEQFRRGYEAGKHDQQPAGMER